MPEVRLPDGRVVKNVPEGTTKAELARKLGLSIDGPSTEVGFDRSQFPPGTVFADPSQLPPGLEGRRASEGVQPLPISDFPKAVVGAGEAGLDLLGKGFGALAGGIAAAPVAFEPEAPGILSNVSEAVSAPFSPRTREGELSSRALQFPFEALEKGADVLGEATPGGPGVQTAVKTGILGLPALLGPGRNIAREGAIAPRGPLTIKQQVLKDAQAEGFAVPSSDAVPGLARGTAEGLFGKPRLNQDAAFKNQQVTNNLAARELGLAEGTEISLASLDKVRADAGQAYNVLENAGTITPTVIFRKDLSNAISDLKAASKDFPVLRKADSPVAGVIEMAEGLNQPTFQASSVIAATKVLRDEAGSAFRNGQPKVGSAYRDLSKALEDAAEAHLNRFGDPAAVQAFRQARERIAKSFSVEKALKGDGVVSAPALAQQRSKRAPLTGGLDLAARFAEQFPKAAAVPKGVPISTGRFSGLVGGGGAGALAASGQTLPAAALAALTFGGPLVRSAILSKPGQSLIANPRGTLTGLGESGLGLLESGILADDNQ